MKFRHHLSDISFEIVKLRHVVGKNVRAVVTISFHIAQLTLKVVRQPGQKAWVEWPNITVHDEGKPCTFPIIYLYDTALKNEINEAILSRFNEVSA